MTKYDVLVIGGSAAGNNAAQSARRHYPDKSVAIVRREPEAIVPWHLHRVLQPGYDVLKQVLPDAGYAKKGIDLLVGEVRELCRERRMVKLVGGEELGYERLVLATGSTPIVPPIPDFDRPNVLPVLKTLPSLQRLAQTVEQARDVVILGGGFTGMEFADECLKRQGVRVTVEALPCCLYSALDEHLCRHAERLLTNCGARVLTATKVASGRSAGGMLTGVELSSGEYVPADVVLVGAGARPQTVLAEAAGLTMGPLGGIAVAATMRTQDECIFAAGDCAAKTSFATGKPSALRTAGIAAIEGRVAGANLYEARERCEGIIEAYCTTLCGKSFVTVGITQRLAQQEGFETAVGEVSLRADGDAADLVHARLVFDKERQALLGVQVIGMGDQRAADTLAEWVRTEVSPAQAMDAESAGLPGALEGDLRGLLAETAGIAARSR